MPIKIRETGQYFDNLDDAVCEAPANSTLLIPAGSYTYSLPNIQTSIHLIGLGHRRSTVVEGSFLVKAHVRFSNLTICSPKGGFAISSTGSGSFADVFDCTIRGSSYTAMYVQDGGHALVMFSTLEHAGGSGVFSSGAGTFGRYLFNHVHHNKEQGIQVYTGAKAEVRFNRIHDNKLSGIKISDGTQMTTEGNTIYWNGADVVEENGTHIQEGEPNVVGIPPTSAENMAHHLADLFDSPLLC